MEVDYAGMTLPITNPETGEISQAQVFVAVLPASSTAYKYDGVKVIANNGVVQLTGLVNTRAQLKSAEEIAAKVVGVKRVENNLTAKF